MKLTARQYAQVLFQLSREREVSAWREAVGNFLLLLRRRRETKKLPAILQNFERLEDEASGIRRVRVTTSVPLTESVAGILVDRAKHLFGVQKVLLESKTDPNILAGVKLQTETELFDGTIRRRLREMKKTLSQ